MKKKLASIIGIILIFALVIPTFAQGPDGDLPSGESPKSGLYIVLMVEDPAIAYQGDITGLPATKPGKGEQFNPNSARVKKYTQFLEKNHNAALQAIGATPDDKIYDYTIALNGFTAELTPGEVAELSKRSDVRAVVPDVMRHIQTDNSPDFLGLTDPAGPWAKGYTGEDVVVGVVDTGIWPEHPSFADDGSYGPPPASFTGTGCDFGNTAFNPDDASFTCNNKLLAAKKYNTAFKAFLAAFGGSFIPGTYDSARDDNGHGSHTSSTAAGNADVSATLLGVDRGIVSGIAPRARVSMYKACWSSTLGSGCFLSDLAAAINTSVADGVDVINYSIGGGASLTGADEIAFLFAADAGVFVATSAGNSGPGPGTVGGPATAPWLTAVGASTQNRTFQGSVVLGSGAEFFGASVTGGTDVLPLVDSEDAALDPGDPDSVEDAELCFVGALDPAVVTGKIVLCKRGVIARVDKSRAVFEAGGLGTVLYNENDAQTQNTDNHWTPTVHINNTDGLAIKAYIDAEGTGATAQIFGGEFTPIPAPWMADFSSRGPDVVATDIIKPDVTAPGVNILAANSPTAFLGAPGQLFQAISGTSMSSPHVAGVFALLKQVHPDWTPAMAKSALMTTAHQDVMKEDGATLADPFDIGGGHIRPGGRAIKGSLFQPGLAYDAGFFEYLGFLCTAAPEVFANPAATCAFLESEGIPLDPSNLNLASIGVGELVGSQTITRTVTSVATESGFRTYNVSVDAPPGFDVTVSPSTFRIRRGQSASYAVTITNDGSASIGEWAFGSLTWKDRTGLYSVRSPIAVRAFQIEAPAEVFGTGTEGSLSFDVKFGYTGDYTAAPHGLVARTDSPNTVDQDPDQTFDCGGPGETLHVFDFTDVAFARFTLIDPNPDIDIDLYSVRPDCTPVASSTNAGTDELIEVMLPEPGEYHLFAHGWQVGGPHPYTLMSWLVPTTTGGSLSVDSAPASATVGETGTVVVSWSGLSAGTEYLGAVSHSDADGILALTLVNVNTE